jgi:hypothetical protein
MGARGRSRTPISRRAALGLIAAPALARPAASQPAGPPVDTALVLAVDCSASINTAEYVLQRDGYARAFADMRLARAIAGGAEGAIAVAVLHWAGQNEQVLAVPWRRIADVREVRALARTLGQLRRGTNGDATAIGATLDTARLMLRACPFAATRRVIDISGDGVSNAGRLPEFGRDAAVDEGIIINGLPLLTEEPWLDDYYRARVVGGPGAFVLPVPDLSAFARAVLAKLLREVAGADDRLEAV